MQTVEFESVLDADLNRAMREAQARSQAEKNLAKAQQALTRKKRGSHRRKKAVQQVAGCHSKIANQRRDFQHKASHKLVNQYQIIVFLRLTGKKPHESACPQTR